MPDKRLRDRAKFWGAVAAVLSAVGGVAFGFAAVDGSTHFSFANGRVILGLLLEILAFLALRWVFVLRAAEAVPAVRPSGEPALMSSSRSSPRQTRRQQQMAEFQSKGRAIIESGEDLEEQLRAIPEDAPREIAARFASQVANYDARVTAFFIRWGEASRYGGISSVVGDLTGHDLPDAVVPGPPWRRSLVERVSIARGRVRRRIGTTDTTPAASQG